jgi:hypothetical protein
MRASYHAVALTLLAFFCTIPAKAATFNEYILAAVDHLEKNHARGGYDINKAFSHKIEYGSEYFIKATSPPQTMCVAAVAEVIIYAIKIWAERNSDFSMFQKLPASTWNRGTLNSLRANIFMYAGTGSRGTAHALQEFGLGKKKTVLQSHARRFHKF